MVRFLAAAVLALSAAAAWCQSARVVAFNPTGEAKDVRQVVARFSEPMVNFGDPRTDAPFDVDCAARGRGRWSDARVWLYDFEADLPAGLVCRFALKAGAKSVAGTPLVPAEFTFSTGGPAIRTAWPNEGDETIDEAQVFLLALDAPADPASVRARAACVVEGIGERIPLEIIEGDERKKLVAQQRNHAYNVFEVLTKRGQRGLIGIKDGGFKDKRGIESLLLVARCARPLPPGARVDLVWDAGIQAASGIATGQAQTLPYRVRPRFTAKMTCTRVNPEAGCVPVLPITLVFTAPVARDVAERIEATTADGRRIKPVIDAKALTVDEVELRGPFPPRSEVTLALPARFADDAGRTLDNAAQFPLKVRVDDDPPLVRFPARFGILEAHAEPALPVSVRNVEPALRALVVSSPAETAPAKGSLLHVDTRDDRQVARWMRRLLVGPLSRRGDETRPGELPLLTAEERASARPLELPSGESSGPLTVIGIPLPAKGLHAVELASPKLGRSLHGEDKPYYVYAGALVTNLAVHFKRGGESSLVWVTRLDDARPVAHARVQVSDCRGEPLWSGNTDAAGVARVDVALARTWNWNDCPHAPDGLLVTARQGDDFSLLLSTWTDGIRPWQFNLAGGATATAVIAHTVTDRPLFRAGETASMKHVVRRRTGTGFALPAPHTLPKTANLVHLGSGQRFETPLAWNGGMALSTWAIPKEAKAGEYQIQIQVDKMALASGTFRVEQFRVPLMRAVLKPPAAPVIRPASGPMQVTVDAQLSYMSGGPAAYAPVKFRSRVTPYAFQFRDYEDFFFGGKAPKEGVETGEPDWMIDFSGGTDTESAAPEGSGPPASPTQTRPATLDADGGTRLRFDGLPRVTDPQAFEVEMEYADPNGQILTAATRAVLLPSNLVLGMRVEGAFATRERLAFKVQALDHAGRPVAGRAIRVEAYERKRYAYRKRLLGGFYAYEQSTETRRLRGTVCKGQTDARGLLACDRASPASGEVVLVAQAEDDAGNAAVASRDVFIAGGEDMWFEAGASDRIDLLPDKRAYEPGETARFEVRMPFRSATALVTVEREGVLRSQVVEVDARSPFVEVKLQDGDGPNTYVSALVVRGRIDPQVPGRFTWLKRFFYRVGQAVGVVDRIPPEIAHDVDTRPTGLVDLTRPAFRLGIAQVRVGWRGYQLDVRVEPEKSVYRVRDKAAVSITVTDADGKPAAGAEVALAAVDEGLLALMPNRSWDLLGAMMQRRPLDVETSTAQGQVIGKRHFGKKALAPGGGGGSAPARELFDTLLAWQGRLQVGPDGRARVEVPLNDSLTAFRIEAIAHAGEMKFGSGGATVRTTQDVMLFAGLPPFVREGDRYDAMFTVRNGGDRALKLEVAAAWNAVGAAPGNATALPAQRVELAPGAAQTVSFKAQAPVGLGKVQWRVDAREIGDASAGATPDAATNAKRAQDTLKITQTIGAAYPVRVYQQTLIQLEPGRSEKFPVALPEGAVSGRGGVDVRLARSLGGDFAALREWMAAYPFTCFEQRASQAVALEDAGLWSALMNTLPAYLDRDGLVRYFPSPLLDGDDTLTAYVLAIAHEAKREIPDDARQRMLDGLANFVAGRVNRYGSLPTADLTMRRIAAIDALARYGAAKPAMLEPLEIAPNLWPSSAVLDWWSLLTRLDGVPRRAERLDEARSILRARLMYAGTTMNLSTEKADYLWWLMVSPDRNAVRALLLATDDASFKDDIGRMARGALGRQRWGRWNTTVANAWGVLALRRFQAAYERDPVAGSTTLALGNDPLDLAWGKPKEQSVKDAGFDPTLGTPAGDGPQRLLAWPSAPAELSLTHQGTGKPWVFVAARAALPLKAPLAAGYAIQRKVAPVEQKKAGAWTRGDVYRVTLDIEAQADMTWVAVADAVPAGATILGTGLGGDAAQLTAGEARKGWTRPSFEERTFEGFRAYYAYVPKGRFSIEYTVRLNNGGLFELPAARVEAMYAPEVFGEVPVAKMEVGQ